MNQKQTSSKLFELGYLWSVKQSDLLKLAPSDPEFRDAVLAIEKTFEQEYAQFSHRHYGELVTPEGRPGPALNDLLTMPRCCPLPDVPPPPNAAFWYPDELVQQAVVSQQHHAALMSESKGSGSWPYGCWDGFQMHRMVVSVDESALPRHWEAYWEELKRKCREAYSWTGLRIDFVAKGEPADVRISFRSLSGSTIGLAQFPPGTCHGEVFCYFDPKYNPGNAAYLLNLLLHEHGHNTGLNHTGGLNIMAPTINLATPDWRRDSSWPVLSRFFGGKGSPDILGDNPSPQPEAPRPAPPQPDYNGVFTYGGKIFKIKVYE